VESTSSVSWESLYAGYRWDIGSSLYSVRNRNYHSTIGSWMTRDPLTEIDTANLYLYVENSPINIVDPSGLTGRGWPKDCCDVLGAPGINWARNLATQLIKKIRTYLSIPESNRDQNHWDNIDSWCKKLALTLKLIRECYGPRTFKAQEALDLALDVF